MFIEFVVAAFYNLESCVRPVLQILQRKNCNGSKKNKEASTRAKPRTSVPVYYDVVLCSMFFFLDYFMHRILNTSSYVIIHLPPTEKNIMMAFQMMAAFATTSSVVTIGTKAVTVPVTGIDKAIPLRRDKNTNPPQES